MIVPHAPKGLDRASNHRTGASQGMMPAMPEDNFIARLKDGIIPWNSFPIVSSAGWKIGRSCLVTRERSSDPDTVDMLCRWRLKHKDHFLSVFDASPGSTRNYLETIYLTDNSRILFLLKEDHNFVGNYGLANISAQSAEIDNVIRGEQVQNRSFMHQAQLALIHWASDALGIRAFHLHVLAENTRAIRHYEHVGFKAVSSTPLRRQDFDGGYRLIPDPEGSPAQQALLRMALSS